MTAFQPSQSLSQSRSSFPCQIQAPVVALECVAPHHFLMTLEAPEIAARVSAGQFVHILPREAHATDPLLRRAFSVMAARNKEIDILFRAQGNGTRQLARRRVGDFIDVLGPLGQAFDIALFHVKQREQQEGQEQQAMPKPILVGGGVGVPPLIFLGRTLRRQGFEPLMLLGARGIGEVLGRDDLQQLAIETRIATDDGSLGRRGHVTELLEEALQGDAKRVIYACGPWPMLRAVAALAACFQVPCQVSLEENMPCGIGVCNGCVIAMRQEEDAASDYGRYQRICMAGPALWADQVDWEAV